MMSKKQQAKEISEPERCSHPSSLSYSAVGSDELEWNLSSYGMIKQEIRDLNLPPDGHLPLKQTNISFSTPEEFGVTAGGFHAFDGSRFSPIEEASLVLNSRIADVCALELCSHSISMSDSVVLDDDFERDLMSSGINEQELLDLKVPPDGIFPENWNFTSFSTPEKSETRTAGGHHTFDGSRFSPIEEAFLVLNSPTANVCASEVDKEVETTSENFDLFERLGNWDMPGHVSTEMLQIQNGNVDSMRIQKLQESDSIVSNDFDLEELEFRKISNEMRIHFIENEAIKAADHCDYNDERSSNFPLFQSVMEVKERCGCSYQEPFFMPTTQNSYRRDEDALESPPYKMDPKCKLKTVVQAKGTKSQYRSRGSLKISDRDAKLQRHEGRMPSSTKTKSATVPKRVNSETYAIRSPCVTGISKTVKNKSFKNPFTNSSQGKMDAIGSVLAKTKKHQIKQISEVDCFSNPSSLSNSSVIDDNSDCDLISSEMSEKELLDLNLLPDGILQQKWIDIPISTPKKSETVITGGFHSFDGSRFSPIEDASLVLNSHITHVFAGVAGEEDTTSEDIDLFGSLQTWEMSGNESTEMLEIQDDNVDSILPFQLHSTRYCDLQAEDMMNNSEESTSDDNCTFQKSTSGDSCFGYSSFESPIQNNLGICQGQTRHCSQHKVCDSMASSNLTSDLEEHDFENRSNETSLRSLEDEANKIVDDDHECDLISFEMSEQELFDFNLLSDGGLPEKWISTPVSTPKKSEPFTAGGFHSFDGSRFSPIEEASLVLNSPIADVLVRVADKETETSAEDIDLFESLQSWEMSGNMSTEMLQIHHTQYCDSWAEDQLVALAKQTSEHLSFDPFNEMVCSNYNEEWSSILPLDYNSHDLKSLSQLEKVGREREVETLKAELLEVKRQIKELGRLLKRSLRRTDLMQQNFARCKVVTAW